MKDSKEPWGQWVLLAVIIVAALLVAHFLGLEVPN